ncbi:MAG: glycoside hydrolase family 2, partial [Bacteroidia bacterium]|nr:glycoside hydrolase family 2 [Bacteroidia bacterium]
MKFKIITICTLLISSLNLFSTPENQKQLIYLSGKGFNNTKTWEFFCTDGRNSGHWTRIEVPSCWEQQGFGNYEYGRNGYSFGPKYKYANEKGLYKLTFHVPETWKGKEVNIVFEGSMTDTEVKINGKSAGEIHQGSFYRFKYNITDKIVFGGSNLLEVTVSKLSADESVNRAERYGDYWNFGGIYRPVFLEAFPKEHISRVAINAKADGSFSMDVFPENLSDKKGILTEIFDADGRQVAFSSTPVNQQDSMVTVTCKVDNPNLWTSETPYLYNVRYTLFSGKKKFFGATEKFGFRTIEVRHGDGIYLNGTKIKMKGVNRHCFWPEGGRTLNYDLCLQDVKLIKEMNMNAVRCSHYPPDVDFLNICDSLGLYVLDEIAGWQRWYDTPVGKKIVKETVIRDVNHPSIIFWDNGNEGGTNKELDKEFLIYDPSKRDVIHPHHRPGNAFNGIDCNHYENYNSVQNILKDSLIYMTTEFLHCQDDGGGGSGLYDYWELMWTSEKSAGGFL